MRGAIPAVIASALACGGGPSGDDPVRITVPRGASVSAVADTLVARGVLAGPRWFRVYTKVTGNERGIQAGVYEFVPGAPVSEIVRALTSGGVAMERLVIPEGLMVDEIAAEVERQLGIPADSLRAAARDSALARRLGAREPTLEGYLYPETYLVPVHADARAVVRQMTDLFETLWRPEWDARLDTLGMSRDELVTLASIIEGEIRDPQDRYYVSSVYHNRLRRRMRLQADPTVIYALGRRRRLFVNDYRTPSRYNTYLIDGLPPHPIAQPSTRSIDAALYPAASDFLYFVAGPDGKHIFSRTFREHQAAIRSVRGGS